MAAGSPALLWLIMKHLPVLSFLLAVVSSQKMFSGDQVLRVRAKDEKQLQLLRNLEDSEDLKVDFWHGPARPSLPVDMRVPFSEFQRHLLYRHEPSVAQEQSRQFKLHLQGRRSQQELGFWLWRHQVFQINIRDRNHIDKLKGLSNMQNSTLTFWNLPTTPGHPVNVVVTPASLELVKSFLESHGFEYSVSIKDLQAVIDKENEEMKFNTRKEQHDGNFNYGAYHSLDELYLEMANITSEYPNLVSLLKIANSFENRPLYVLKFSTGKEDRPAIWLNLGLHSREWITQATGIWIARKIASDFSGNNTNMTSILDKMDIFLMPVANPDGYVYSQTKDRLWRKNRSYIPGNKCLGVDLNRNWDVAFSMGSHHPCSLLYHGPSPHSEVEVKSVANFIRNHGNFKSFIDFHSFSQILMYPYGYISSKCPDFDELDKLGRDAAEALHSLFGTEYRVGSIYESLYFISGSSMDWAYKNGIKYAFTFEMRDTGKYGFLLPAEQILPTAQETWLALEVIMEHVKDHLHLNTTSDAEGQKDTLRKLLLVLLVSLSVTHSAMSSIR
ncbi:carboxypeptidase A4-like isoform X2 [Sminthopsis crassicaudata]|uniref:carboxypeptidase A4-like isoform X2 n=2 Tax=Sminthopsis crassicaudata TaxID=9301 RepID=UPI003D69498E